MLDDNIIDLATAKEEILNNIETKTIDKFEVFAFNDNMLRTLAQKSETWFVAKDICNILELNNVSSACSRLDEDEVGDLISTDAAGRPNKFRIISESGMYSLTLTSRKPEAKLFKRWVTHEVLPTIRKTGSYSLIGQNQEFEEYKQRIASVETSLNILVTGFENQSKIIENQGRIIETQGETLKSLSQNLTIVAGHTTTLLAITQDNTKERKQKEAAVAYAERKVHTIIEQVHGDRYSGYTTISDYIKYTNRKLRTDINTSIRSISYQVSKYISVNKLEEPIWTPINFTKMFLISILDEIFEKYYFTK